MNDEIRFEVDACGPPSDIPSDFKFNFNRTTIERLKEQYANNKAIPIHDMRDSHMAKDIVDLIAYIESLEKTIEHSKNPTIVFNDRTLYAGQDAPCVFCTQEVGSDYVTFDGRRGAYHNECFQRFQSLEKKVEASEGLADAVQRQIDCILLDPQSTESTIGKMYLHYGDTTNALATYRKQVE